MPLTLVTATILAGQSLSAGVDLSAGRLVRIRTPRSWTTANLTFQCASDNVLANYRDLYDRMGKQVMMNTIKVSTVIGFPADITHFLQGAWIKARSGTAAGPVVQPADASFDFVLWA